MSILQASRDPRYRTLPEHERRDNEHIGAENRKKYPIITPLNSSRAIGETLSVSRGRSMQWDTEKNQRYALMKA